MPKIDVFRKTSLSPGKRSLGVNGSQNFKVLYLSQFLSVFDDIQGDHVSANSPSNEPIYRKMILTNQNRVPIRARAQSRPHVIATHNGVHDVHL